MAEPQATPGEGDAPTFLDSFEGDDRGFVENKGWKGAGDLLKSYRGLESIHGTPEDRIVKLPDDPNAEGAMDDVWTKLGRPESADKYTKAVGDDFQEEVFKKISETAFKNGITDTAFKALQEDMTGIATAVMEAEDERSATAFDEWKGQNAEGFQNAARLMANVGVNEDQLEGILSGDKAKLYDFLANVAKRSAEGKPIDGETKVQDFAMSPEAARAKRSELLSNKDFMERYTHTSQNVREPAMKEMEALTKIISASKDKS
jgi:post-segregation antitoxin (ccd killing protein)